MPFVLPKLVQRPAPCVSERPPRARIRLIVVHDTEGGYQGAVAWFSQVRSQVSAHMVMREDGAEATQMAPLSKKAWHACAFNGVSIGIEGAGSSATGYSDAWWRGMAAIVAWLLLKYNLPVRWAQGGVGDGFCSHHDLGPAGGGHTDPCAINSPDWRRFIGLVQDAYHQFAAAPLPDWAEAGTAPTSALSLPQPVTPTPSHDGSARAEPGDAPEVHPTPSTYPAGSIADIQARLVKLGFPVDVDGLLGPQTQFAVKAFQRGHQLEVDGIPGPLTTAELERLTA
jgi:N-acetyl-anhydromuramyl-L-alanine amidase AmpD